MAQCLLIFSFITYLLSFLALCISFCAPFWLYNVSNYKDLGLWGYGYCNRNFVDNFSYAGRPVDQCHWKWAWFEDWAWQQSLPGWWVASQVLFAFGILTLLGNLLYACAHHCLKTNKGYRRTGLVMITSISFLGLLQICLAMCIFGGYAWQDMDASINSSVYRYNWGFFVAITSTCTLFIASCSYAIVAGMHREDTSKTYSNVEGWSQ